MAFFQPPRPDAQSSLELVGSKIIDLGTVGQSEEIDFEFKIKNVGLTEINILGVASSCSCSVANVSASALHSEDVSTVTSVFKSGWFRGRKEIKFIVRYLLDDEMKYLPVTCIVNVDPDYDVSPTDLVFFRSKPSDQLVEFGKLKHPPKFEILNVQSMNKAFEVDVKQNVEGESRLIKIGFDPTALGSDIMTAEIVVETNSTKQKRFTIFVTIN